MPTSQELRFPVEPDERPEEGVAQEGLLFLSFLALRCVPP